MRVITVDATNHYNDVFTQLSLKLHLHDPYATANRSLYPGFQQRPVTSRDFAFA